MMPRPCSAAEAVARAQSILGQGHYALGTGNYSPGAALDLPWTTRDDGTIGVDCAGLICWAYKLPRGRLGYNRHGRYDVEDDLNTNSMLGDAFGARDLFQLAATPEPGDCVMYPSFYLYDDTGRPLMHDGKPMHWIGHVGLVVGVARVTDWNPTAPAWHQLDIVQAHGPDGATAPVATDGSVFWHHDASWPKPQHRCYLVRSVT